MRLVAFSLILAGIFWFFLFSPYTAGCINFWLGMSFAALILLGIGLKSESVEASSQFRFRLRYVLVGIFSAVVLYGIFFAGRYIVESLVPFAAGDISLVYRTKSQASPGMIATLLFLLIGPAEEIFWRGYIQQQFCRRWGQWIGYGVACGWYALVHVFSGNSILLLAALVCGLFWGFLYLRYKSVWPGIISHAIWDVAVFVVFPLR